MRTKVKTRTDFIGVESEKVLVSWIQSTERHGWRVQQIIPTRRGWIVIFEMDT